MRHTARWMLAIVVAVAVAATPVHAQPLSRVPLGTSVRVETCNGELLSGRFSGIRNDSVTVTRDSVVTSTVTFPPDRVTVERAVPTNCVRSYALFERYRSSTRNGALIGAGLGLTLATVAYSSDLAYERTGGAAHLPAIAFAIPVAVILTGLGAWMGHYGGEEVWSEPRAFSVNARVAPSRGM